MYMQYFETHTYCMPTVTIFMVCKNLSFDGYGMMIMCESRHMVMATQHMLYICPSRPKG